jgi:voltage-gated potassium channel
MNRRRETWREQPWFRRIAILVPPKLRRIAALPIIILAIGTIGYPIIEGEPWTAFDGFYMTAITLTTIGYAETYPLSNAGRLFTVGLAFGGVFVLAYVGTEVVRRVVTGELRELLGKERMEQELKNLRDHVIVCGLGRMGRIVCDELEAEETRFVAIERDIVHFADWKYKLGVKLPGDATVDEILRQAGVERAKALITVIASDADNLYVTLSARLINPKLTIVARAEEEEADAKLRRVGASKVVSPYLAGGQRAVHAVLRPTVLRVMELANRPDLIDLQIEEVLIQATSPLIGRSLKDSQLGAEYGILIAGIQTPGGGLVYAPQGQSLIVEGSTLIALGQRRQLDLLEKIAAGQPISNPA